jgi:hypothetical protein
MSITDLRNKFCKHIYNVSLSTAMKLNAKYRFREADIIYVIFFKANYTDESLKFFCI